MNADKWSWEMLWYYVKYYDLLAWLGIALAILGAVVAVLAFIFLGWRRPL